MTAYIRTAIPIIVAALFSATLTAKPVEEDYRLEALYNDTPVGTTHVHFTWASPGTGRIAIAMKIRMPVLFLVIPVSRSWYFDVTNYTELVNYYCDSSIEFGNYHYQLYATNYGTNVYMRKESSDGAVDVRWYPRSSYDYLTGNQYSEVLLAGVATNRTLRFLDLDSVDLYTSEYTLHSNYTKLINKRPEPIYAMSIRSGFLTQELQVMARTGVPLTLRINIPVVGWVNTRLTNATIEDVPAK